MRKKILFLIQDLGGGGAEKVLVNLVNHMNMEQFDITVMALFGGGVNEKALHPAICYKAICQKAFPGNSKLLKYFSPEFCHKLLIREHYDIEVAYLEGNAVRIISGCRDKDTKIFAWIHSFPHTMDRACIGFKTQKEALHYYKRFTGIACVSEMICEQMKHWYPQLSNLRTIYNASNTQLIENLMHEPLDISINDAEIKMCGVGKLVPLKRFDVVARIHKRLRDEGYPLHTYVLGTGEEADKLRTYIIENDIEDTFTLCGYRTNPYNLMSHCDIFICSSQREGFSTATIEALLTGLAVVATPVSGMEEILGKYGEYGIIAGMSEDKLYAAVKKLLDSPELMDHYKKFGKKSSIRFSMEKTVRAAEEFLLQRMR